MSLPSGTVTFLFSDIEGSTKLWETEPNVMQSVVAQHDALAASLIESHGGVLIKSRGEGDSLFAVFALATDAASCVLALQRAFLTEVWEGNALLRVRMALHTGEVELRDGDYFGPAVNRCARLRAAAHGAQVLVSGATQQLVRDHLPTGATLLDLGEHRLRDLSHPERVFQLRHPDLPADFPPLKSLDSPSMPNNLPQQLTSFVGREKEMEGVKALLMESSLLTLMGSGGCGKTRLALQVAAEVLDAFPDGVWLAELAPVVDPGVVAQTVAQVLGVREEPGKPILSVIADRVKGKRLLIVLDNCEHVLSACVELTSGLLRTVSDVKLLATSREGLGLSGEQTYRVPSLSLPDPARGTSQEQVVQYEAARLFIDRARLSNTEFFATDENAAAIAQLCYRLDGIPLALELAAARVRSLSVEEINAKLDNRFRLLTGGSRTALPRQQTLRALIDWSYDLLGDSEKTLLHRLSVFSGGWTLPAAELVCAGETPSGTGIDEYEVIDLLASLIDKSLVMTEAQKGHTRYRLLETVRQYARDRLLESGEAQAMRQRHCDYFLDLAEEAHSFFDGPQQTEWLARLEQEHDNLRVALEWCGAGDEASSAGLRMVRALWEFWHVRGHGTEGLRWLTNILAAPASREPLEIRADALNGAGVLAVAAGNSAAAQGFLDESLAIWKGLGSSHIVHTLNSLAYLASLNGNLEAERELNEEALRIARRVGNRRFTLYPLRGLGELAYRSGDLGRAEAYLAESVAVGREFADRKGLVWSLMVLSDVKGDQGDPEAAASLSEEAAAIASLLQDSDSLLFALMDRGYRTMIAGDNDGSRKIIEQVHKSALKVDNRDTLAWCYVSLSSIAHFEGNDEEARSLADKALALLPRLKEEFFVVIFTANLAWNAWWRGDIDTAAHRSLLEDSLARLQKFGRPRGVSWVRCNLAWTVHAQGDLDLACSLFRQTLTSSSLLSRPDNVVWCFEGLARVEASKGRLERAVRLLGASEAAQLSGNVALPPQVRQEQNRIAQTLREELGESAYDSLFQAGRSMTAKEAIVEALYEPLAQSDAVGPFA